MGTIVLADVTELETIKISELPESTSVHETDIVPMVTSNVTKKMSKANFVVDDFSTTSRVVYVGKNGNDSNPGTICYPFLTIQAAINYAYTTYGIITNKSNVVVIHVMPGIYTEQIHNYDGYCISGDVNGWDALSGKPQTTLYNTGADESHYPLRSNEDENYTMIGINIQTDTNGVLGKIPNCNFQHCMFTEGDFIERNSSSYSNFSNCVFSGGDHGGFNLTGTNLTGTRNIVLQHFCKIKSWVVPTFLSTHTAWNNIQCTDTIIQGNVDIGGDWEFRLDSCVIGGFAHRNSFDTTKTVKILNSAIKNGMHFKSAPSEFVMISLTFMSESNANWIPAGEADITADVDITCDTYINNSQHNGLSGKIILPGNKRILGPYNMDSHLTLQDAIDSIPVSGEGVIILTEDASDLDELTIAGTKTVTIDGQRAWNLTFTNDIIELGLDQNFTFSKIKDMSGGVIEINGNNAELHFHDCNHDSEYSILLTSGVGASVHINGTNYTAPTGLSALQINSADPSVLVSYSKMVGAAGQPAIEFTVEADNKLKTKFSTFIHGDGAGNSPLLNTAANSTIAIYSCGLNASWSPSQFTNSVGQANNTTDPQIDF